MGNYEEDPDLNELSEEEEDGSIKKRKVVQACDACRKKKVKCDGVDDKPCTNCKQRNATCVYTPTTTKRGPRQGYIETLEKRLELMEKLLQPLKNIELRNFQPNSTDGSNGRDGLSSDGLRMIPSSSFAGSTNSPHFADVENYLIPDSALLFPSIPSPPTPPVPVVTPEVSEHLISLYFTYQHPLLSIIHRTTFLNAFRENKQCSLLLYTIYALASRFSNHPEVCRSPNYTAGEEYIAHAKILLESSAYSTPYLTTVQALVLISLHELGCDRYPTAWMYSGLAVRMGQHLNLYCTDKHDNNLKVDWVMAETRRRTWFGCCLMDRLISTKTSWPMAIHDEDCQVRLPGDDYNWENSLAPVAEISSDMFQVQLNDSMVSVPDHMYHFGKLIFLMGQVNQYTNRSTNSKKVDAFDEELLKLDRQLLEWLMELPPHLQYSTDFLNSTTPESQMMSAAIVMLHCLYHAVMIVLHRSNVGRYLNLMEFIDDSHTSSVRCVMAASTIVTIARDLINHRFKRFMPFYPYALYAAGSIHANRAFAQDPIQAEQSRADLELIYSSLLDLQTHWGISKTYCTSLRGLYALRSSRETIPDATDTLGVSSAMMNWMVPLKSSLHEWYPYLEKLSKGLGHDFCSLNREDAPSSTDQTNHQPGLNRSGLSVSETVSFNGSNSVPLVSPTQATTSDIQQMGPTPPSNLGMNINFNQPMSLSDSNDLSQFLNFNDPMFTNNLNFDFPPVPLLDSNFMNLDGDAFQNLGLNLDPNLFLGSSDQAQNFNQQNLNRDPNNPFQ